MTRSLSIENDLTATPGRLNIACVSYYLPPNDRIGAGYQMHHLANAYVRKGHRVTMFSQYDEKSPDALYDIRAVPVGARNRTFRFAWNLRKQDFSGFDLLHAAGDDYWLLGKRRPYHIRTFYGSCLAEAMHVTGARDRLRMLLLGLSEAAACGVADRRVCISDNTRRYVPFAHEVIWTGVDLSAFRPGVVRSPHPAILFVGTMNSRKRGSALLETFQREILPALPTAELWIVRETSEVHGDNVRWFGPVSQEKLVELYQQAWVFCLPSSYEGVGVPYIEAMACGTAVVATPNVGAREVLANGRYGRIADLSELGKALVDLLTDAPERRCMEQRGVERAQGFSWDSVVEAYLSSIPPIPERRAPIQRV